MGITEIIVYIAVYGMLYTIKLGFGLFMLWLILVIMYLVYGIFD